VTGAREPVVTGAAAEAVRAVARRLHDPRTYVHGVPYDDLARLRRAYGVVRVDEPAILGAAAGPGYWLVLRHADVQQVMTDPATFSSAAGGTQIRDPATPRDLAYVRRMMLNMDPPEHSRLRRMVARSFTPRAVAQLETGIRGHARRIVDRMLADAASGECDFAKDVAADLPLLTLADVLGVPPQDRWLLFDWSNRVIGWIGWQDPDYATSASFDADRGTDLARAAVRLRPKPDAEGRMPDPRTRAGMPDLYEYANRLGERKRREPAGDVMSILMAQRDVNGDDAEDADEGAGDGGGQVSVEEFENMFWLFAVAGNETLRNGIPGGVVALLAHPDAQRALRDDRGLLDGAVEEMLRWWTPVMTFRRTASGSATIAGVDISPGDKVVVSFASANRDEGEFDDPDRFDITRARGRHLVFGHGPHFCLGAHLARMQIRALFGELLSRTSWLEAAGEPAYLQSNFQRGVIGWRR
jgi:cytochrome P450